MGKAKQRYVTALKKFQRTPETQRGTLGNMLGQVKVPNQPDMVYVMVAGLGTREVKNTKVANIPGIPVNIGYDPLEPNIFQVLDTASYPQTYNAPQYTNGVGTHGATHNWAGNDVVWIEKRQLMPLRVTAIGAMNLALGRDVVWNDNQWVYYSGVIFNVSAAIPATGSRYALIYAGATGSYGILTGTVRDLQTMLFSDLPAPILGTIPSAIIRLYAGQTGISEGYNDTDIIDVRGLFTPIGSGTGGGTGGGHTIQDQGTPLTARSNLNFAGAGVTATDDAGNGATLVTIPGGGSLWYNVVDYGADGNGSTDDTDAVQDALNAATVNGGTVYFPIGTYMCNTLTPYRNVSMIGEGKELSIIKSRAAEALLVFETGVTYGEMRGKIHDLRLDGDDTGTIGIDILMAYSFNLQRVGIYNFTSTGLKLRAVLIGTIKDCWFEGCPLGIDADAATLGDVGYVQPNLIRIESSSFRSCATWGIKWVRGAQLHIENCEVERCGTTSNGSTGGIYYKPILEGLGMFISGLWAERNYGGAVILIDDPQEANQLCAIENSLIIILGTTTYGIIINGASLANAVVCKNVAFYNHTTTDFFSNGIHSTIYLNHCVGTTGGTGAVIDESTPTGGGTIIGVSGMPDPTTVAGDMIYRSAVLVPLGANQATAALGASASYEHSDYPTTHPASHAIDGNESTFAYPGPTIPGEWLAVDLGAEKIIRGHRLHQNSTYPSPDPHESASQYKVQGSSNGSTWIDILTVTVSADDETRTWDFAISARYFRLLAVTGGNWGWAIFSLELYLENTEHPDRLAIGNTGQVLTVVGGVPAWAAATGGSYQLSDLTDCLKSTNPPGPGQVLTWHNLGGGGTYTWEAVTAPGAGSGDVVGPASATDGHLAVFDATTGKLIKDGGAVPAGSGIDGWTAEANAWTYSSADAPTFVASVAADLTGVLSPGMRIKLTQTTVKYFIVTAVGAYASSATPITLYGGTDYTLANAAISNVYFSPAKAPFGFPLNPAKWIVEVTDTSNQLQATPTNGTWYNPGSLLISVPIGAWQLGYDLYGYPNRTSANTLSQYTTLSTANNSESNVRLSSIFYVNSQAEAAVSMRQEYHVLIAAKTSYYLNCKTGQTGMGNIGYLGATRETRIYALCAYL